MKRSLTLAASALLTLSFVVPALARENTPALTKLSRRLVRSEAILNQHIVSGALPVDLLLQQRKAAQADTTGRADLYRSKITTRVRTVRGSRANQQLWKVSRPSRRSIINQGEKSAELPPTIVQTGGNEQIGFTKVSRRTLRQEAEQENVIHVGQ